MKKLFATTILSVGLMASPVLANDENGFYIQGFGGLNFVPKTDVEALGVDGSASLDPGAISGIALGYELPHNFRVEGEFSYRWNEMDEFETSGVQLEADGDVQGYSFMGNVYYDFNLNSPITPYVGLGAGYSIVDVSDLEVAGVNIEGDTDGVMSGQVMAGVNLNLTDRWSVGTGYRYLRGFEDVEISGSDFTLESHSVEVNFRYSF